MTQFVLLASWSDELYIVCEDQLIAGQYVCPPSTHPSFPNYYYNTNLKLNFCIYCIPHLSLYSRHFEFRSEKIVITKSFFLTLPWLPVFAGTETFSKEGYSCLGSGLSTYWPTKRPNTWRCSHHTSADQTPIPCDPAAPPGLKPKWRVCEERPLRRSQTGQAEGLKTSACYLPMKHCHALVMPAPPAPGECRLKYKYKK